ncbi:MAG: tRNA pseudouridine(55) synthase TruB [candidate division Zixibacteria bacterium]|nr:tRNA pseudouridine(55) synthase TruB [candidate division Zixibacteria bacterium]
MHQYNGILLCDKPFGQTSHDVVDSLRLLLGQKKIGHTGTLDPRATGLMVICLGQATKIARFITDVDKTYEAEVTLGQRSSTYDAEGIDTETPFDEVPNLGETDIISVLSSFKGAIKQNVPMFSAVKVNGKRLYKSARKGEVVETPLRNVFINAINLINYNSPVIKFEVSCSKGTYIRTIANDIGDNIGCGAYLSALKRTKVGNYSLEDTSSLKEVELFKNDGTLANYIKPIESVLRFPSIKVNEEFSSLIISGRSPQYQDIVGIDGDFQPQEFISLRDYNGKIKAIGISEVGSSELDSYKGKSFFTYVRVLN